MSEHLPECPKADYWAGYAEGSSVRCICQQLRACEQRALQSAVNLARERQMDLLSCNKDDNCHTYAYMAGVIADDIEYILMRDRNE